jgi:hypothetical protein
MIRVVLCGARFVLGTIIGLQLLGRVEGVCRSAVDFGLRRIVRAGAWYGLPRDRGVVLSLGDYRNCFRTLAFD